MSRAGDGVERAVTADWSVKASRLIANILSPPVAAIAALAFVLRETGADEALPWALVFLAISVVPPLAYVWYLLRRGEISDFHLPVREERYRPFVVTLASAAIAVVVLASFGAPRLILVVAAAGWLQALVLFAVTLRWKISTHCAAIATAAAIAAGLHSLPVVVSAGVVPLVAWSRVRLDRHDRAQVVAGSILGWVTTAALLHAFG